MKKTIAFVVSTILFIQAFSQIIIENTNTVEWYVQNLLLGEGVLASNITFNGAPGSQANVQCGYFNSLNSNVGLDSGLVLSSGNIDVVIGPNNSTGATSASDDNLSGDPDLEALIPGFTINDIAILEFDFIPSADTLNFQYVFGSEEYLEWVNSSFNDVFGFFLSGPGISGPYSSPPAFPDGSINIALVPGTNTPVAIDNVNDVVNSQYYFNNELVTGGTEIQLDGFTVPLTAAASVICGETYHIKLAIADAGDFILDSAVFLEANSFESVPEELALETFYELGLVEISGLCDSSFSYFSRSCAVDTNYYQLKFAGEAIEDVDYDVINVPDTIIMPPGQFTFTFGILAFPDGIDEDPEEIEVVLCATSTLDEPFLPQDTAYLTIFDQFPLPISGENVNLICPTDQVVLTADVLDGTAPYDYVWYDSSGNEVGDTPVISVDVPDDEEVYTVDVIDLCGLQGDLDITVTNSIPPDPVVTIQEDDDPFCPGAPYDLTALIQDGTPGFSYLWSTTEETETITVTAPTGSLNPYPVQVFITDFCNRVADVTIDLIPPPLIDAEGIVNDLLCLGDDLPLSTFVEGGTEPYQYTWLLDNFALDQNLYSSSTGDGNVPGLVIGDEYIFTLFVTDYCSQFDPDTYIGFDTDTLDVISCFVPNVFTPNGDSQNDEFRVYELLTKSGTLHILNRWGVEVFSTTDFSWDGGDFPDGTYYYVVDFNDGSEPKSGFLTLLR